jgi:tetratricopeptide (TPR) repeat protein
MQSTEASEYCRRAATLRSEGRLEESVLAARKATALDPDDANAWWQLALSLQGKDDSAILALERVSELAPDFAPGWNALGGAYLEVNRRHDALTAYEASLDADSTNVHGMRMVALLLKADSDDGAVTRRLELLRQLFQQEELDDDETFDLAYLLGEARETSESVRVYEHYTQVHGGGAAFYNLALGYRLLGRDADAWDALEAARTSGFQSEKLATVRTGLQESLRAVRDKVLRRSQPYLPKSEWFRHYVNPFVLLNVAPGDIEENPKALQRAKQALLREIELEDGAVAWLPGLTIDKSAAMAQVTELDREDAWRAHEMVFRNPALNDFLMRGDLAHFLIREDGCTESTLPHLIDKGIREHIGPKFSAQYAHVLLLAIEQNDLLVVQCMMGGRRWGAPGHEGACFDSAKRLLIRMSESLVTLAAEASTRGVTKAEVESAFLHRGLGNLLSLLPIEFYDVHSAVGRALRGLSVSYYNRSQDAEGAKAILALGRDCARKSPSLAHQLEVDEKTLEKIIDEEKKNEAHLRFTDRNVSITKAGVEYGSLRLAPTEIVGVRWGIVQTSAQPPTHRFTVGFEARRGHDIVVTWSTSSNLDKQKELWGKLVDATTSFILDSVVNTFQGRLDNGEQTRVGSLEVRKDGVVLTAKGWFSDKQVLVPWAHLSSTLVNGSVVLRDATNRKATAELPVEGTYNALLLHLVASRKGRTP